MLGGEMEIQHLAGGAGGIGVAGFLIYQMLMGKIKAVCEKHRRLQEDNKKIDARIAALENARLDTASKDDIKELAQSIRETNKEIGEIGGKLAELVGELRANRNG